jgi:uncharacterized protein (TIGR02001 family)
LNSTALLPDWHVVFPRLGPVLIVVACSIQHTQKLRKERIGGDATMMTTPITKSACLGIAALLAAVLLAAPTLADGMPKRGKAAPPPPQPEARRCTFSANVSLTSDYIFRGFSQTAEGPAIQGGFDATCGIFYAGVWASTLDFAGGQGGTLDVIGASLVDGRPFDAHLEVDLYTGIKPKTGPITWDLGFIYYAYPNATTPFLDLDYYEFKLGASAEIWKGGTLGVTAFYAPDYQLESGRTWTIEAGFVQAFSQVGMITPSISALLGYQNNEGSNSYRFSFGNGDDEYLYWNAGLALGFLEKWSLDLRYWDTDISNAGRFCELDTFQCDARFVATLKFTY